MNLRRRSTRRKTGFTLPEIIVTISLIAALAAVVVPTVISQVKKGDPSRIGNDFLAVRGASEQFLTDIRKYPSSMYQLTNVITTSQTGLVGTSIANYGQAEVNRWRGPYLNKDSAAARITGYGLKMNINFDTVSLASSGAASAAGQKYMVIAIPMTDSLSALEVDRQFDDGVLLTGAIRYLKGATDTLKFLLMPIY